ncbi:MAG: DUF2309 domain-containing protein [Thermonemataceae bacterium]|nr:DUF2309 domain-containing protein [Thermonemataceae bacterium]
MFNQQISYKFDEWETLHLLAHYLPHQNPLKDFVHHNTLGAYQELSFHKAMQKATTIFGYKTYMNLDEYRKEYEAGKINPKILQRVIIEHQGFDHWETWQEKLLHQSYQESWEGRVGRLHQLWTSTHHLNIEKEEHNILFRLISNYIDQGITIKKFPIHQDGFLASIRDLEKNSYFKIFKSPRVDYLLFKEGASLKDLLDILIGSEEWYEQYLFDQQFAHPGWSGMVAVLEHHPETLLDTRKISLREFIFVELLLEIDALDRKFGNGKWQPLGRYIPEDTPRLFGEIPQTEIFEVYAIWQESMEWTLYDQVLRGLQLQKTDSIEKPTFQALFCMDDREGSIRRYIEKYANAQTFGTPGFFNLDFYYQPEGGKFYTKSCPAPMTPQYLVKETDIKNKHHTKDLHFSKHSKNMAGGLISSQTFGFWSAIRLAWSIFKPTETPAMVSSFKHMDKDSTLHYECTHETQEIVDGLQVGYTLSEMIDRMEGLLKSIGLTKYFSEIVYLVGHGASSVNNTHYAGYDCGACSGRAGSVNARVAAFILNKAEVRAGLRERNIFIPDTTHFVAALRDTTRDEIIFFDEELISLDCKNAHEENKKAFTIAHQHNAKERSRRFLLTNSKDTPEKVHKKVKLRAMSLFEPRPEWNHASNALCIVGRRESNKHLFLDRRSFLNSYDYTQDIDGTYLLGILDAVAPVAGGINLEYYFSKVDNHKLGAGSKLPHNVVGLVGVANGLDGDLRTGLPAQMLNIHDSLRLLVVVEHYPEVVQAILQKNPKTYEWFANNWVNLVVIHPETKELFRFEGAKWLNYKPITQEIPVFENLEDVLACSCDNMPISIFS